MKRWPDITVCDSRGPDSGYPFNIPVPLTSVYFHLHQTTPLLVKWKCIGVQQLQSRTVPDENGRGGGPKGARISTKAVALPAVVPNEQSSKELKTWRCSVLLSRTSTSIRLTKQNAHSLHLRESWIICLGNGALYLSIINYWARHRSC